MKNWRIGVLGLAISATAVVVFYRQVDTTALTVALSTARYIYLLPATLLLVLGLVTRAMRWYTLLGGELPIMRAFHIMNIAYLVNGVLPFRIGEVGRIYLVSRHRARISPLKTASTIVTERLLDLMSVILMALFSLYAVQLPPSIQTIAVSLGPLALVAFLMLILLSRYRQQIDRWIAALESRAAIFSRLPIRTIVTQVLDGLGPLSQPRMLLSVLMLTALSWGLSVWAGYVLMYAFYDVASFATTFLYISAAAFAIAVPAVPGNIGTYEAAILLGLEATGYAAYSAGVVDGTALSFAVMVHGLNLAVHASTGVVGFVYEGITLQQLSRGVHEIQHVHQDG